MIVTLMKKKFVDELHWITEEEMLDMTALAESAPGAIAVNAAILVGWQVEGLLGMITAVVGTILPPMVILSIISYFYNVFAANVYVALVLKGMQAGVAAVILDVVCSMGGKVIALAFGGIPVFDGSSVCGQLHFWRQCGAYHSGRSVVWGCARCAGPQKDGVRMIYLQLYLSFLQVGLFSVGGGYAAMPLIRSQVVELHPWMTLQEFTNLITIAEMTPGPIAVNCATFVGLRIAQLPGAVIATLGCITPALVLVSLLAWCYRRWRDLSVLQSVLACLRPAVVALILGAGLSILGIVVFPNGILGLGSIDWIGTGSFFAAFILLRKYKWNPILTMCLCGAAGLGLHLLAGTVG